MEQKPATCACGSGLPKKSNFSPKGTFIYYSCDRCHREKMRDYRGGKRAAPKKEKKEQ